MGDKPTSDQPEPLPDDPSSPGTTPSSQREDIEIELIRSLLRLTEGRPAEFGDILPPPRKIAMWLRRTDVREVRGMLIATLRRWHELLGQQPGGR